MEKTLIGKVITERDGKLAMVEAPGSKFPRGKLKFVEKTLKLDVTAVFKIAGNEEAERLEEVINAVLENLREHGEVTTKYDVL